MSFAHTPDFRYALRSQRYRAGECLAFNPLVCYAIRQMLCRAGQVPHTQAGFMLCAKGTASPNHKLFLFIALCGLHPLPPLSKGGGPSADGGGIHPAAADVILTVV